MNHFFVDYIVEVDGQDVLVTNPLPLKFDLLYWACPWAFAEVFVGEQKIFLIQFLNLA